MVRDTERRSPSAWRRPPADLPDVHPSIANIYRAKVATFTEVLDDPDGGAAAAKRSAP